MTLGASLKLFFVTTTASDETCWLVNGAEVAPRTGGMPQVDARELDLRHVASSAEGAVAEVTQVEAMRLVTIRALRTARVKRSLGPRLFVTLGALQRDLRNALRMWLVA